MKVTVIVDTCSPCPVRSRLTWGVPRDASGSVSPTPHHYRKLIGEPLMATQMTATQEVEVTAAPEDRKGNPAPVQNPTWATDNTDVLALTPSADGLTCTVTATGMVGVANLQFSADADLGAGVVAILGGPLEIEVIPGQATQVEITAGTPTEQA